MIDSSDTSLTPVEAYLSQLAPGSRRSQLQALDRIAAYLTNGRKAASTYRWDEMSYRHAARVRAWIGRTFRPATGRRMMSALHRVHRECWRLELIDAEHLARLVDTEPVRGKGPPPGRALRAEELVALSVACGVSGVGIRNRAIISLLHFVGLRTVEVVRLRIVDLDLAESTVDVMGKGAKQRVVPVTDTARVHLSAWVDMRGRRNGALFPSAHTMRRDVPMEPIAATTVRWVVQDAAQKARVSHFSPHDLRRTFVTRLLSSGEDLEVVRQLCGHESIETTRLYDRRGWEEGRKAVGSLEF